MDAVQQSRRPQLGPDPAEGARLPGAQSVDAGGAEPHHRGVRPQPLLLQSRQSRSAAPVYQRSSLAGGFRLGPDVRRTLQIIPLIVIISVLSFVIIELPPGDFVTMRIIELEQTGWTGWRAKGRPYPRRRRRDRPAHRAVRIGQDAAAAVGAGPRDRAHRNRQPDPGDAQHAAGRVAQAVRGHRAGQGRGRADSAVQVSRTHRHQPAHQHHRLAAAVHRFG